MQMNVISNIACELDRGRLLGDLRIEAGSADARDFLLLADRAVEVGCGKVVYGEAFVEKTGDATVRIEGVTFTSKPLRKNLDAVNRVFPYVATCGRELDALQQTDGDFLKAYWLDVIKAEFLSAAMRQFESHVDQRYGLAKASRMSPGSGNLSVWPIQQQRGLFSLFDDVKALIGVELTDSCLMTPNKSVSGVRFATERDFRSCQLCHRESCSARSAPFDENLWRTMQGKQ